MASERNEALVRRMFVEMTSTNPHIDEIIAEDWINNDPQLPLKGREGARQLFGLFLGAFPDLHSKITGILSDGDWVAASFEMVGTNTGPMMGHPPTGKPVKLSGVGMFRIRDGKVVENRVVADFLGMMQQLGFVERMGEPARVAA
jgi:predicted ester cyclase